MQSLEIRATVGSLTYLRSCHAQSPRPLLQTGNSSRSISAKPTLSEESCGKKRSLTVFCFSTCSNLLPQIHPFSRRATVNKPTGSQVLRGVSGFISRLNAAAAGPLNWQRSDHGRVQSHTSSFHTLSNSGEYKAPHFTGGCLTQRDICRKPETSRLHSLFLICSE